MNSLVELALVMAEGVPAEEDVSPGLLGFAVVFSLVLATIALMFNMSKHLRKVRYSDVEQVKAQHRSPEETDEP